MPGVIHDFECFAHGKFEARTTGKIPRCPKGCSPEYVKLVFLQAPGHVSARTRTADRLVREAATMQGLSDISTSPSRPGGSVAHRNWLKNRSTMKGPNGRQYPGYAATVAGNLTELLPGMQHKANELQGDGLKSMIGGLGHEYNGSEWKKGEDGKVRHEAPAAPIRPQPTGTTGTSVDIVREKP